MSVREGRWCENEQNKKMPSDEPVEVIFTEYPFALFSYKAKSIGMINAWMTKIIK